MKLKYIYLLGLFFIGSSVLGQEKFFNTITYGLEAGYTNGQMNTRYFPGTNPNSFYAGINAHVDIPRYFTVKSGLLYSNSHALSKLHIPLLAKIPVTNRLSFIAGPQLSAVLSKSPLRTLGLDIGAGLVFDITDDLFVEGRYNHEFTNRLGALKLPDTDLFRRYNSIFLGVGYKIF